MVDQQLKASNRTSKNYDSKKSSPSSKKQNRKGENPIQVAPATNQASDLRYSNSWVCKNSACRAVVSVDDSFCRRCSCCICHLFDDNKDPSLWLVCESESPQDDSCGSTCHIECAFQRRKVGVTNLGQFMQLDGSYCCASCGKVSGIIGYLKKQLVIAKEARRVDVLCYRIFLSYRLLCGTSRFKELHDIVKDAKSKLELDLGSLDGVSDKMGRGIVSRLSIASDVQKLCTDAIKKADEWLTDASNRDPITRGDSLPSACRFLFEEVTPSSIVIVLIEIPTQQTDDVKGYKLWYSKSGQDTFSTEPVCSIPREKRRILISNLQPCTEYTFRIVSCTESGDLGHSEARCFTKSTEITMKKPNPSVGVGNIEENSPNAKTNCKAALGDNGYSSGFKVRDLGKVFNLARAPQTRCLDGFCSADIERCCGSKDTKTKFQVVEDNKQTTTHVLDLNVVSVPDLNEDLIPPFESSRDEDNVGGEDDSASHGTQKNEQPKVSLKRSFSPNEETPDCNSTLINGSPLRNRGGLDENFEDCIKIIRWLECEGHMKQEFRLKLLTWFSLRSTEQERRVVNTFIQALVDDPRSLAGQLVDTFSEIVNCKKPRNSFTSKSQFDPEERAHIHPFIFDSSLSL